MRRATSVSSSPCSAADEDFSELGESLLDGATATRPAWCCRAVRAVAHALTAVPLCACTCCAVVPFFVARAACPCTTDIPHIASPSLFFDGGGWAVVFGLGVVEHLRATYDLRTASVVAISSGNVPALCVVLGLDPRAVLDTHFGAFDAAMAARPLCGLCDDLSPLRDALEAWLPEDAHLRASGRLTVVVSPWPQGGFTAVAHFRSRAELVDAVAASCSLPGFVWRPHRSTHESWRGCFFDAALQNRITPIDDFVDVAVRPYAKNRPGSLVPSPAAYIPRGQFIRDRDALARKMAQATQDAAAYAPLKRAFAHLSLDRTYTARAAAGPPRKREPHYGAHEQQPNFLSSSSFSHPRREAEPQQAGSWTMTLA